MIVKKDDVYSQLYSFENLMEVFWENLLSQFSPSFTKKFKPNLH